PTHTAREERVGNLSRKSGQESVPTVGGPRNKMSCALMGSVSRLDDGSMERQTTPMPTRHLFRPALFALALGLSCPLLAADTQLGTLQVSAGELDRRNVAVSFPLPT